MIRKLLATALLLCATAQISQAYYYVQAYLQGVTSGPDGSSCATVYVFLYEDSLMEDGTELHIYRGGSFACIGECSKMPYFPNCPTVTLGDAVYYTDSLSPKCAATWLSYPGVECMVKAAIELALPQNNQVNRVVFSSENISDQLQIVFNPACNVISINAVAKEMDRTEFNIYDSAGRVMDGHLTIGGNPPSHSHTINVSAFPRGKYTAAMVTKAGQRTVTPFTLR